jgi:SAM-dependent methyltransferase
MFSNGEIGYRILRTLRPPRKDGSAVSTIDYGLPYSVTLRNLLGPEWERELLGRTVIDFGCGQGRGSVEMAQHGAGHVIGIDIREDRLAMAERLAQEAGVEDRCEFVARTDKAADLAVSIDAFEHFDDPAGILRIIRDMMRPGGRFVVSFGPSWYHPYGGHFFSVFPWSHLMFSERAQIRWRAEFKNDGATRFTEVQGGLNLMTIAWFERLVAESGLVIERLRLVPIRKFRWFHNRRTREFTTALVECLLSKPELGM